MSCLKISVLISGSRGDFSGAVIAVRGGGIEPICACAVRQDCVSNPVNRQKQSIRQEALIMNQILPWTVAVDVYIIEGFKNGAILASKQGIVTGGKDLENQQIWDGQFHFAHVYFDAAYGAFLRFHSLIPGADQIRRSA